MLSKFLSLNRFARFAWFLVAYNIFIIVWGALVRASKSGDGCGSHYPLCNGEFVPPNPTLATIIEFTHRLTSGFDGILVLTLAVWALVWFRKNKFVVWAAILSLVFTIVEGAIGAFLVKFELVAGNVSLNRAIVMSFHLVNTLILLMFLTATAYFASGGAPLKIRGSERRALFIGFALLLVALVGMSGAVSALGNTLFPGRELSEALLQPDVPFLLKLFVWIQFLHPALSVVTSFYLVILIQPLRAARNSLETRMTANAALALVAAQMLFGVLLQISLAPIWMQLVHLLLAELMWIALVVLSAATLAYKSTDETVQQKFIAETELLSEAALAENWSKPEEDEAWSQFQPEVRKI